MQLNYLFSEWLGEEMFDRNPIQKLEFKTKETPDLNTEYQLENIIYTDTDEY